jgi:phosphoribosylaminoimidazole-succinocarboxamide synthase
MRASALQEQLSHTLDATDFPALGEKYQGKVRDTYAKGDRLVLITTDRLSAFDHVLTTLPFKGDLLNTLAHFWFQKTSSVVKNHVLDMPDPCVTVAKKAQPYPVEFVVRGYLTGSLWRDYEKGGDPYGLELAPGLKKDSIFPTPLLTPSTKAPKGEHDLPLSEAEILSKGLLSARDLAEAKEATLALFAAGQAHAKTRGLILVDTKYEFGKVDGKLTLIDEMHTPDSSRFWEAKEYDARYAKGEPQLMLDKENLRQWLINERGFSGHGPLPSIPDDVRIGLTEKYLTAYERITGTEFKLNPGSVKDRLAANLKRAALT